MLTNIIRILDLPEQFRPKTSITYLPFKDGLYLEEYFYQYISQLNISVIKEDSNTHTNVENYFIYVPVFWTNIQNHPGFKRQQTILNQTLQELILPFKNAKFFTVVQHIDGPLLILPKNTIIFGSCKGTIPIPLIYEDTKEYLLKVPRISKKKYIVSFIGSNTHPIRALLYNTLSSKYDTFLKVQEEWTPSVSHVNAELFINITLLSKFCLAPRGYGRSSFRFFEAIQLDCIPIYTWDDDEWLPYKELIDYSKFSISIHSSKIPELYNILKSISDETYASMVEELKKVKHWFTLEGMSNYIIKHIMNTI